MALIKFGPGAKRNKMDDCVFNTREGQVAIEFADGAEDNSVTNSKFNTIYDAQNTVVELFKMIDESTLQAGQKKELMQGVIAFLSPNQQHSGEKRKLIETLKYIGDKAVDLFVDLAASGISVTMLK